MIRVQLFWVEKGIDYYEKDIIIFTRSTHDAFNTCARRMRRRKQQ